ncbi:DUF4365 domain-containing protein [Paraburkholderia sabiae]|uniref:DUF4365 domain-containing protein n=1 Tax=Paraburkholderia sabiae TaxID=273251 RepID=A0ABU9QPA1_9BURK|nr:DUF4365 domain-containing protein [Paraburkholderia sabiae]WJZ74370.1 DUF4365 domain-containing protein [Paraburkholderia sabiae]CAD6562577.1 hypothetical protein LMG24235_07816 [Paraburkholderia sabiae]
MFISNQKEQFNVAYVHAIASQAGLNTGNMRVDDQSIDLDVDGKIPTATKNRFPKISLQLKATSQKMVKNGVIKFPLPRKNYDDLKNDRLIVPRYLIVLLVPDDTDDWIQHHAQHMSLHNTCYWASIKNDPSVKGRSKVTVDIPLTQRLNTVSLLHLVTLASEGKCA